jgi:hypothetical protein
VKLSSFYWVLALLAAFLFLGSCSKDIQNQEAVRQGVVNYLDQRSKQIGIDMSAMDVKVTSVSFEKDVAHAGIAFVPKGLPNNSGMSMSYVLDRKGDKWIVRGRGDVDSPPHGGVLPGGAPNGAGAADQLPPGHPPAGSVQ